MPVTLVGKQVVMLVIKECNCQLLTEFHWNKLCVHPDCS